MSLQDRLVQCINEMFEQEGTQKALNIVNRSLSEVGIRHAVYQRRGYLFVKEEKNYVKSTNNFKLTKLNREGGFEKLPANCGKLSQREVSAMLVELAMSAPIYQQQVEEEEEDQVEEEEEDQFEEEIQDQFEEKLDEQINQQQQNISDDSIAEFVKSEKSKIEQKAYVDMARVNEACDYFTKPIPTTVAVDLKKITNNDDQLIINEILSNVIFNYEIEGSKIFYHEIRRAILSLNYHCNFSRLTGAQRDGYMRSLNKKTKHTELQRVGKRIAAIYVLFGPPGLSLLHSINCPKLARLSNDVWEAIMLKLEKKKQEQYFESMEIDYHPSWEEYFSELSNLLSDEKEVEVFENKRRKLN